jgi:hypothetical protein
MIYEKVHSWLKYHYGKSNKCENDKCEKKSTNYQWAKLSDKKYECKRENFWMLCASCHRKYDSKLKEGFMVKEKKVLKIELKTEIWKKIKILSIQKEMPFDEIVNIGLEYFFSKKKVEVEENPL